MWQNFLISLFTSLAGSGLLTWCLQERIKHKYAKKLATHEANLKRDYDLQIERLKQDSALTNIRFSHVFDKIADTIIECYDRLIKLKELQENRTRCEGQERAQYENEFRQKATEFFEFFTPKKIFLPKRTSSSITSFLVTLEFLPIAQVMALPGSDRHRQESDMAKNWERYNNHRRRIEQSLEVLETDFQQILGFPKGQGDKDKPAATTV